MSWTGGEFLGLTHIDQNNSLIGGEPTLQFDHLDPCRHIHARLPKQTGQKCYHGEHSETEQADDAEPANLPATTDLPA